LGVRHCQREEGCNCCDNYSVTHNTLSVAIAHNDLAKPPLRAAGIELTFRCSGSEQWSEHFIFSQPLFQPRLSKVRAPVCRLLGAGRVHIY
jgi:hypothetical protein